MANIRNSYHMIFSRFELYFMGTGDTKPQAATISCAGYLDTFGTFFANQAEYDVAIKKANNLFGRHEDSYWPGSVGGFQVANGDDSLMVLRYWAKYLKSQGFIVCDVKLVELDEYGNLPSLTDDDRANNDVYEDAVQAIREHHYEGRELNAPV